VALPFVGATTDAGSSFPRLSIQQYASLSAEFALWPSQWGEILRRYQVMKDTPAPGWRAKLQT
jgi:hypothetical protein